MEKKTVIINWKFENENIVEYNSYSIKNIENDEIICCNFNDIKKFNLIINTEIDICDKNKIIILLHKDN